MGHSFRRMGARAPANGTGQRLNDHSDLAPTSMTLVAIKGPIAKMTCARDVGERTDRSTSDEANAHTYATTCGISLALPESAETTASIRPSGSNGQRPCHTPSTRDYQQNKLWSSLWTLTPTCTASPRVVAAGCDLSTSRKRVCWHGHPSEVELS